MSPVCLCLPAHPFLVGSFLGILGLAQQQTCILLGHRGDPLRQLEQVHPIFMLNRAPIIGHIPVVVVDGLPGPTPDTPLHGR